MSRATAGSSARRRAFGTAAALSFGSAALAACAATTDLVAYDSRGTDAGETIPDGSLLDQATGSDGSLLDHAQGSDGSIDGPDDDALARDAGADGDAANANDADASEDAAGMDAAWETSDGSVDDAAADADADAPGTDGGCVSVPGGLPMPSDGDGGLLLPYAVVPVASAVQTVAIGDVNGDGLSDLVVSTSTAAMMNPAADYSIFVFLQNRCGGLSPPVRYVAAPGGNIDSIAIGDVNGDGRADVVVNQGNAVGVFAQNVVGTLGPLATYSLPMNAYRIATGDLNGDGREDVFVVWNQAYEFLQTGSGTLAAPSLVPIVSVDIIGDVQIADVTGDRRSDVVVFSRSLRVVPQLADGTLGSEVTYPPSQASFASGTMAIGDVTGDGLRDVVACYNDNQDSFLDVFAQNGSGGLAPPVQYNTVGVSGVGIADFDRDGRNDVVTLGTTIQLRLQTSAGTLAPPLQFPGPLGCALARCMAVGDLNADGYPDLAMVTYGGFALVYGAP